MTREYAKNREEYFREFHSVVAPVVVLDGYEYERNRRREIMEQNMTDPITSINSALENFWEETDGSNDPTESEELLQLSSDGD